MARAREREKALYPGMFRHRGQAPGGSNTMMGGAGPSTSGPSAQWQAQVMAQQRQYQKQQQQQQQQQIAMLRQQMYAAQMLQQQQQQKKTGRAAAAAEDDGEVVVLDGSPETSEIVLDGSPTYQVFAFN